MLLKTLSKIVKSFTSGQKVPRFSETIENGEASKPLKTYQRFLQVF